MNKRSLLLGLLPAVLAVSVQGQTAASPNFDQTLDIQQITEDAKSMDVKAATGVPMADKDAGARSNRFAVVSVSKRKDKSFDLTLANGWILTYEPRSGLDMVSIVKDGETQFQAMRPNCFQDAYGKIPISRIDGAFIRIKCMEMVFWDDTDAGGYLSIGFADNLEMWLDGGWRRKVVVKYSVYAPSGEQWTVARTLGGTVVTEKRSAQGTKLDGETLSVMSSKGIETVYSCADINCFETRFQFYDKGVLEIVPAQKP